MVKLLIALEESNRESSNEDQSHTRMMTKPSNNYEVI